MDDAGRLRSSGFQSSGGKLTRQNNTELLPKLDTHFQFVAVLFAEEDHYARHLLDCDGINNRNFLPARHLGFQAQHAAMCVHGDRVCPFLESCRADLSRAPPLASSSESVVNAAFPAGLHHQG